MFKSCTTTKTTHKPVISSRVHSISTWRLGGKKCFEWHRLLTSTPENSRRDEVHFQWFHGSMSDCAAFSEQHVIKVHRQKESTTYLIADQSNSTFTNPITCFGIKICGIHFHMQVKQRPLQNKERNSGESSSVTSLRRFSFWLHFEV